MGSTIDIYPVLKTLCDEVIERAQLNLGATRRVRGANGKFYRRRAVASGKLKASLNYTIRGSASAYKLSFGAKGQAAKYFRAVNDGRKAGSMPPTTAILQWMKTKPIRLRGRSGGFIKTTEKGRIRAAFAIAKSIEKRGIAPFPYYTDAINEVLSKTPDTVLKQLDKEIQTALKAWQ